jgi:hypothetical protein
MLKNDVIKSRLSDVKLVKLFFKLNFFPINYLVFIVFKFFRKNLEKNLLKGDATLKYLDLYKLGLLFKKAK